MVKSLYLRSDGFFLKIIYKLIIHRNTFGLDKAFGNRQYNSYQYICNSKIVALEVEKEAIMCSFYVYMTRSII